MNFDKFLTKTSNLKTLKLGGITTQLEMTPLERKNFDLKKIIKNNPKESAVLILFYPNKKNETCFLLTKRASYNGTHSAQISFPGGKKDTSDLSLKNTALRETFEEVAVNSNKISHIRPMTKTYIPPSNFWVYPFLSFTKETPIFKKNYEVDQIIEVPLNQLLNAKNLTSKMLETSYMSKVKIPCFDFNNHIVWGATAMILNEVKTLFLDLK
jgi:8-oxo-dGTP pyrophosphatase MutT (NUDIX family)